MSLEDLVPQVTASEPFIFTRPAWQTRANCHPDVIPHVWQPFGEFPSALFFPEEEEDLKTREARLGAIDVVCGTCPVRDACVDWAVDHEKFGLWGGTTPSGRAQMRIQRGGSFHAPETDESGRVIGTFIPPAHGTQARYSQHRRDGEVPCEECCIGNTLAGNPAKADQWAETKRNPAAVEALNAASRERRRLKKLARESR